MKSLLACMTCLAAGALTADLLHRSVYRDVVPPPVLSAFAQAAWPVVLPAVLVLRLKDLHAASGRRQAATKPPRGQ